MVDKALKPHAQNTLDWELSVDAKDISVAEEVVTLRGNIASYTEKTTAERVYGLKAVATDLVVTTNRNRRFGTMGSRLGQIGLAVLVWLTASPSLVYAHGMTAGEDVSRPLALSGVLALVSYWVVVLWPRRRKGDTTVGYDL